MKFDVRFRRVLVATALVALFASSLFSGPIPFSKLATSPTAQAQGSLIKNCINAKNDAGSKALNITINAKPIAGAGEGKTVPLALSFLVEYSVKTTTIPTTPTLSIYRSDPDSITTYNSIPSSLFPLKPDGKNRWKSEEVTDLVSGVANTTVKGTIRYMAFASLNVSNKTLKTCTQTAVDLNQLPLTLTQEEATKWFEGNINTLPVTISQNEAQPPRIVIPPSGDRTLTLTFKLREIKNTYTTIIAGMGGTNIDWLLFQGYYGTGENTVIENLFLLADDRGPTARLYLSTTPEGLFCDPSCAIGTNIKDVTLKEGEGADTLDQIYKYIMNDAPDSSKNCASGFGVQTGPKKGPNDSPVILNGPSQTGKYVRELNGNCINTSSEGWAAWWKVRVSSQSTDAAGDGCGFNMISVFKEGVGPLIVKIFACVIQSIIKGVFVPLTEFTQGTPNGNGTYKGGLGEQTGVLESNLAGTGPNKSFYEAWKFSLGLINVLVILALLAIAFANILHLNLNTYAAKKALPGLVIGVVGANASLLLIRFVLDVAKALQLFAFDIAGVKTTGDFVGEFMTKIGMTAFENTISNAAFILASPVTIIVIIIFAIFMFYLLFVFAWAMLKRLVYIYGLTVLAPLAFVSYGIPGQQQWFTKWWDMMLRQIFMLPVVFLGAALLIRYVNITVVPPNTTGPLDVSNIINMLLVFLTAAAILKLPGLITKGAIDITGAAKKAFGMAKVAPQNMMNSARTSRLGRGVGAWTADNRGNILTRGVKRTLSRGGGALYASGAVAGNYEKFGEALKKRWEGAAKTRGREATTVTTGQLLGHTPSIRGRHLGFRGDIGISERFSGRRAQFDESYTDEGTNAFQERDPNQLYMAPEFRDELATQSTAPGVNTRDFLNGLVENLRRNQRPEVRFATAESIGVPAGLSGDISGRQAANFAARYSAHFNSPDIRNQSAAGRREEALRRLAADIGLPPGAVPSGSEAVASGAAAPSGSAATTSSATPSGRAGDDALDVRVVNPITVLNPENEALAGRLAQHAQSLAEKLGGETISNLASQENVGHLITEDMRNVLQGELGSLFDNPDLVKTVLRAGAGGGVDVIRQHLTAGQAINQTNNALGTQTAQISDEQLEQLGSTISASNAEALKQVGGMIAPHLENISKASGAPIDPKIFQQYSQRIIDGFRQVMTTGPKSMRSYLQSNLTTLASTFAKEQNISHITPESIVKAISQAESRQPAAPPAAQTSTTNVTNVSNLEQITPVESAPSAQKDIPDTPINPEPPTQP